MYKFTSRVLCTLLAISSISSSAFALSTEFKNSLMKIEATKISDTDYNLNLYTKNKFIEPIKIIKKSDLNYYVLLPETKNESNRTTTNGIDIRSISANVYPYAGQDVENGYVKININTTKPINFKVNIKSSVASATASPKTTSLAKQELKEKIDIQKKNSDFSTSKKKELVKEATPTKQTKKEEVKPKNTTSNSKSVTPKKEEVKPKSTALKKEEVKPKYEAPKHEEEEVVLESELPKIEEAIKQEIERIREENLVGVNEELANLEEQYHLEEGKELLAADDLKEIEQIANSGNKNFYVYKKIKNLKNKISAQLALYGINFKKAILLFFAFMASFILLLASLVSKNKNKNKNKSKTKSKFDDSMCIADIKKEDNSKIKNDGQYFVFDKNIKQTGFCDPATSAIKRNYELSSYEPELKNKYNRNASFKKNNANEYDIIQKILKEDTIIDLPNGSFEQQVKTKQTKPQNQKSNQNVPTKVPIAKQEKPQEQKKETIQQNIEPTVLSSVEIAPQRGFMLVSFNDNINLIGYIFDDVFALHNFNQPKLEKYDIKYRLSEKDDKTARFIVKINDTKMLIAVSKTSMALEVIL